MLSNESSFTEEEQETVGFQQYNGKTKVSSKTEINVFCRFLSNKAGVKINNLTDALNYIEESSISNIKNNSELADLEKSTEKLESENTTLKNAFIGVKNEKEDLESQISSLKSEIFELQKQISSTKTSNKKSEVLQDYIKQLLEQIDSQVGEISQLTSQRNALLRIVEKQNNLISSEHSLAKQNTSHNDNHENESKEEDLLIENEEEPQFSSQDLHFLLAKLSNISRQIVPRLASQIVDIVDEHNDTPTERIESIVTLLSSEIQKLEKDKKETESIKVKCNEQKERAQRCLSMLEEELRFLTVTANSEQFRKALFYESTQVYSDNECKKELIRRSMKVARFVEEQNIQFEETELPAEIQPTEVFKLLTAVNMKDKLQSFIERIENNESDEIRELFCLFSAQVIANSVLMSYATEANQKAMAANSTIKGLTEALQKLDEKRKALKEKYKRVNRIAKEFPSFDQEKNLEDNLIEAFGVYKANQELIRTNEDMQKKVSSANISIQTLEHEIEEKNQELTEKECNLKELEQKNEEFEGEIERNKLDFATLEKEKENLQNVLKEKREKLSSVELNFAQLKKAFQEKSGMLKTCQEDLQSSKQFTEKLQEELKKYISELNNAQYELSSIKDREKELTTQIAEQCIKNEMNETNINDLFKLMDTQKSKIEELEVERSGLLQESKELRKAKTELKKYAKSVDMLNSEAAKGMQWTIWAKRVLSTFDEEYPNESEMRLALESHALEPNNTVLVRKKVESLVYQKQFLEKFVNKQALCSKGKELNFKSLIIVSLCYAKIMKLN